MPIRSRIRLLILGTIMILPLKAMAESSEYVFILRAKGNPYWNLVAAGITETAKEKNIQATVYQGQSDTSAEEQLNICYTAIQRNPKFIAIAAVNPSVGIECLKKASAKGIKIAEIDSTIPLEEAEKQAVHILFSVGSDSFQIGKKVAEFVGKLIKDEAAEVLILEGAVGSSAGTLRARGFKETLQASAPNARIVSSISAEWDRLKAMNITSDTLERFPDLKLVYAANDLMALGAIEALKAHNKLGQTEVIGVDGIDDARRAVHKGEMLATVAQLPYLIGKRSLELGVDVVLNKNVVQREITDTPILTKAVLDSKDSPELEYVR